MLIGDTLSGLRQGDSRKVITMATLICTICDAELGDVEPGCEEEPPESYGIDCQECGAKLLVTWEPNEEMDDAPQLRPILWVPEVRFYAL